MLSPLSLLRCLIVFPLLLTSMAVQAQSSIPRGQLEEMFTNIEKNTKWDMSRNMLWGYFFTNQTRKPLEAAAKDLSKMGYRFVDIYLSDKKASDGPQKWWLHVERIETHNVDSLDKRNAELTDFAEQHGLETYDGMDVGPVTQVEGGKK